MSDGKNAIRTEKMPKKAKRRMLFRIISRCFVARAAHRNRTAAVKNISDGVGINTIVTTRMKLWKGLRWFNTTWLKTPKAANMQA